MADLLKDLTKRKSENNLRALKLEKPPIDFCSNDYLGLTGSETIRRGVISALQNLPNGAGAARLLSGNYQALEKLEAELADFYRSESALLFSTGYHSNLALFSCILKRNDTVLYDEASHASIKDGIRLTQAKAYPFRHNDLADLERKLNLATRGEVYVAVESLYSMDGDFASLKEMAGLCLQKNAKLIVDEAHSNGIFGEEGRGLVCALGLEEKVFARNMTFGKAFGAQGGCIVGGKILRDYMVNFSRPFIYSTAISPLLTALLTEALKEVRNAGGLRRELLFKNISLFKDHAGEGAHDGPIQTFPVSGNDAVKDKARALQAAGYDVRPVLYPTVPKGRERLRICLHSFNCKEEIIGLIGLLYGE